MKIYLIGMPLSGKTTIGQALSKNLSLKFIDLDSLIEKENGYFIDTIFEEYGEKTFRILETEALKSVVDEHDCVIACGGGIVENIQNIKYMQGKILYINTSLEVLALRFGIDGDKRPIFQKVSLKELYNRRTEKYLKFKDYEIKLDISNCSDIDFIIDKIKKELKIC